MASWSVGMVLSIVALLPGAEHLTNAGGIALVSAVWLLA